MYNAFLINDPFGDPGVCVECRYRRESVLFDLGDLHALPARKLLKVHSIFVSHTHMDHFIGFDHLLRLCLGRDKQLHLFGPPGFAGQIEHKLKAYTWNLVENYSNDFAVTATEVHPLHQITMRYGCRNAFQPEVLAEHRSFGGTLLDTQFFVVRGAFLDHMIPCLAFRFEEKKRINIMKNALAEQGLPMGAWLMTLKEQILNGDGDDAPVRVWSKNEPGRDQWMPLGRLKETVKITPGLSISYVTDAICSSENMQRIADLIRGSDHLFIEATFLHEDRDIAAKKHHLTARQAGMLARISGVKRISLFHHSPKYKGAAELLESEALHAFLEPRPDEEVEASGDA
jgi:ribonuclease Z